METVARPLSLLLSLLFVVHCEPFHGLLHTRAFEGSALRREAEEAGVCLGPHPPKHPLNVFHLRRAPCSWVALFDPSVFTERLPSAIRRVLRTRTPDEWDFEGRLVSASVPGESLAYSYDVDGIRTAKSVNGTVTRFVVDKNRDYAQVLEERSIGGSVEVAYVYGDDLISQERPGGALSFYHYDGQLSTRQLTDGTATVTDSYTYDAFGATLMQSGPTANNYLYTGEQHDSNLGFYYLRARYLNHQVGRFVSSDPHSGSEADPHSLHKYLYTSGNPVGSWDPSGQFTLLEGAVIIGILLILASFIIFGLTRFKPPSKIHIDLSTFSNEKTAVQNQTGVADYWAKTEVFEKVQTHFKPAGIDVFDSAESANDVVLVRFTTSKSLDDNQDGKVTWASSNYNRKVCTVHLGNFAHSRFNGKFSDAHSLMNAIANVVAHQAGRGLGLTADGQGVMNLLFETSEAVADDLIVQEFSGPQALTPTQESALKKGK